MGLFMMVENKLKQRRNPLFVQAYEEDPMMMKEKRASLTMLVLATQNEECMEVFAEAFQNPRMGFMNHIYWDDLDTGDSDKDNLKFKEGHVMDDDTVPSCSIM